MCGKLAGGAGKTAGRAGAPPESSVPKAAGGKEPQALALPHWAMLGGSASLTRGGVVRGSGRVHPLRMEGRVGNG